MDSETILSILGDRPIAYHPIIAKAVKSVNAAVFLSQLLYWQGRGHYGDWTYKTQVEMQNETGLTRTEQETARRILRDAQVLDEDRRGVPARLHYRVNVDALAILIAGFQQSSLQETCNQDCGKPANCNAGNLQTITETTPQTTSETTTESLLAADSAANAPEEPLPFTDPFPAEPVPQPSVRRTTKTKPVAVDNQPLSSARPDQVMYSALAAAIHATKMPSDKQRGWCNSAGKRLRDAGYEPQDVTAFAGWWNSDPWRQQNTPLDAARFEKSFGAWVDLGKPAGMARPVSKMRAGLEEYLRKRQGEEALV